MAFQQLLPAVPLALLPPSYGASLVQERGSIEACWKQEGLSFTMKGYELINLLLGKQIKKGLEEESPPASFNSIIISVRQRVIWPHFISYEEIMEP